MSINIKHPTNEINTNDGEDLRISSPSLDINSLKVNSKLVIDSDGNFVGLGFLGSFNFSNTGNGYTGSLGYTGSTGTIGYTGSKGAGYTGSRGDTGFIGSRGTIGYTGSKGAGFTGSRGIQGFIGFIGSKGEIGFTGSKGIDGIIGIDGYTGSKGDIGFTGSKGIQGDVGFTGSRGFTGSQGKTGFTGSQGVVGFTGSKGIHGDIGYTGSQGNDGTITETLSSPPINPINGQMWFDTENGTLKVYYDDGDTQQWVVVSGPIGPRGYIGSRGWTGSLGFAGSRGFTGSQGTAGFVGYTGSKGDSLAFAPIQQGGGTDMGDSKIYMGWRTDLLGLQAQVDDTSIGRLTRTTSTASGQNDTFVAPGSPPLYASRAWVNFNGTGTVAIRDAGNVTSITDLGVGRYSVNFTTAMPDINYSYSHAYSNEVNVQHCIGFLLDIQTSYLSVAHYNAANSANTADKAFVLITVFR